MSEKYKAYNIYWTTVYVYIEYKKYKLEEIGPIMTA